jgi:hypothetical protein
MGPDPQRMVGRLRARQRADGQHSRRLGIVLVVALLYGGFALLRMGFRSGRAEADRDEQDRWRR